MVMDRRSFFKWGTAFGLGSLAFPGLSKTPRPGKELELLSTARNCIYVNLLGAPSQMDTFDFKTGPWTSSTVELTELDNGALWPGAYFPNLLKVQEHFTLVRSLYTNVLNHQRAQYRVETAHPFVAAKILQEEIPPLGALFSLELDDQRKQTDVYPSYISLNYRPKSTGMLDNRFAGFYLSGSLGSEIFQHPEGPAALDQRLRYLYDLDPGKQATGVAYADSIRYVWDQAALMMSDDRVTQALSLDTHTQDHYGRGDIGVNLAQTFQILAQNAGARFFSIGDTKWDHHDNINRKIRGKAVALDQALAALIGDLALTPGVESGKSLLDETLIIVTGEFGRTPGALNTSAGRDHHGGAFSALVAGGGVQGGRIIGETDSIGNQIIDIGWSQDRNISTSDLAATALSAMGINPYTEVQNTPSSRPYYYTSSESWMYTDPKPIKELF